MTRSCAAPPAARSSRWYGRRALRKCTCGSPRRQQRIPASTESTGASRGIGSAIAVELARLGAHVVITARTQGGLEETDDAIRALGGTATLLPLDLHEGEQVDAVGPSLFERFRRLDVLVHNAGTL